MKTQNPKNRVVNCYQFSWFTYSKLGLRGKGATEMISVWKDPDFDASLRAVYYVRVLEIPTPRWTAYDAKYYGLDVSEEIEMVQQERAYTSPIWYTP